MFKIDFLHKLLNTKDTEIQKLETNQLMVVLGVFRYFVRRIEREINKRTF